MKMETINQEWKDDKYTVTFRLKGFARFALRFKIALALVKLAAWVFPLDFSVEIVH